MRHALWVHGNASSHSCGFRDQIHSSSILPSTATAYLQVLYIVYCFWCLIVLSAYTANLTSYLAVQQTVTRITGMEVGEQIRACDIPSCGCAGEPAQ